MNAFEKMLQLIDRIEAKKYLLNIRRSRDDSIQLTVQRQPCEYWEIEIFKDGHLEVEVTSDVGNVLWDAEAEEYLEKNLFN